MNNITYYFSDTFITIQIIEYGKYGGATDSDSWYYKDESILVLHTEPTLNNIQIILGGIKFYANYKDANSIKKFYEVRDKLENDITFMSEFNKFFGE